MGALSSTSPIQNSTESPVEQNELNDNKITVEQIPKPRKFFKSRNSASSAEIQQQMAMQQQQTTYHQQQQSYQNHQHAQHDQYTSGGDEEDQKQVRVKKRKATVKKAPKGEKPPKPEKVQKPKKEKNPKVKEDPATISEPASSEAETSSPTRRGRGNIEPTRSSGRSRAKCVNYNEDAGEDEFFSRIERRIAPRHLLPATITSSAEAPPIEEPIESERELETVPSPQQSPVLHPPIVLRISKVSSNICFVEVVSIVHMPH